MENKMQMVKMIDYMKRHNLRTSTYNGITLNVPNMKYDEALMGGC